MNGRTKAADRLMMALAVVLGAGSIGLFAWDARPTFVPLGWPPRAALTWDAFLSLLFFVQHSGMVRRPFRARLARVLPARYDGAFYAICSGLTLMLVVVLWQRVDTLVFRLEGAARWVAVAGSLLAAALLVLSGTLCDARSISSGTGRSARTCVERPLDRRHSSLTARTAGCGIRSTRASSPCFGSGRR